MNTFKLNFRSQYKTLSFALFLIVGYIVILVLEKRNEVSIEKIVFGLTVAASIFILPAIYLYIEYLFFSISVKVSVDRFTRKIIVEKSKETIQYELDDIVEVIKVCSYPKAENRIKWMATDTFFYYRIVLKHDPELIVTSLMTDNFDVYGIKVKTEKKFFPSIFPRGVYVERSL